MPEGYITLIPTAEQAARERKLVEDWKAAGMVGPHPLSRQARFARGEQPPPAFQATIPMPGLPRR
jgi:hypothetical protein